MGRGCGIGGDGGRESRSSLKIKRNNNYLLFIRYEPKPWVEKSRKQKTKRRHKTNAIQKKCSCNHITHTVREVELLEINRSDHMIIKSLFHQETITIVSYICNGIDLNETNKQHLVLV